MTHDIGAEVFAVRGDPSWCSEPGAPRHCGWVDDPAAVARAISQIEEFQGSPVAGALAGLEAGDDGGDRLFWRAEEKLFGSMKPSWNQGRVGTCVSFGWGRGTNDLIAMMAADGLIEWPGADVATEPIYGGSRVEVGGGRIGGDGSVGAWAAQWVQKWGTLLRKVYGRHDLTRYSESLSRDWGRRGCPDDLEPTARQFPVQTVALVTTAAEAWAALGNRHPIPVCSGVGFESPYDEGFCDPRGSWPHCMVIRGRCMARRRGQLVRAYACQNSWGAYIRGEASWTDRDGNRQRLPEGCFLMDEAAMGRVLRERDSFAIADQRGFAPKPRRDLDWYV